MTALPLKTSAGLSAANGATSLRSNGGLAEGRSRTARPCASQAKARVTAGAGFRSDKPRPRVNLEESPLAWLARRTDKAGRPMISEPQFLAGERLRVDFTRAGLTPRVTTDWSSLGASGGGGPGAFSDAVLAAKVRLGEALSAVGPELSGVLLDVCCFLKGLEAVESERRWPARTAKVVLGLGLDCLARHYGFAQEARGRAASPTRAWRASPEAPDGEGPAPETSASDA